MADNKCKPLPPLTQFDIDRFRNHVDKTPGQGPKGECWEWTWNLYEQGYGKLYVKPKYIKAHRVAYFLHYGVDPYPLLVCHSCDWPPCVRGEHLFKGTESDNSLDSVKKGRARITKPGYVSHLSLLNFKGQANPNSKLTSSQVVDIRSKYAAGGRTKASLAKEFGISWTMISCIVTNKHWIAS